MTAHARVLSATVLRAGLVAAVLAIMAGIFGMHVITGDHSAHRAPVVMGHSAGHSAVANSGGHAAVVHSAGHAATAESCGPFWPDPQESGSSCTPSAKAGSLAVLPPNATAALHLDLAAGEAQASGYSYHPSGPTPCELCISRT